MNRHGFRIPGTVLTITVLSVAVLLGSAAVLAGCSKLADPNQIIIAKYQGENIRRADIKRVLREMTDEERPLIQSRDDLLKALNDYLDTRIKADVASKLKSAGAIEVPRDLAKQVYYSKHPEFINLDKVDDPSAMNVTEVGLAALQAEVEFGIDDELAKLYEEAAIQYKVSEYIQNRRGIISESELRNEYEVRKDALVQFELIEFDAMRFPAAAQAAAVRRRIDAGEDFTTLLEAMYAADPNSVQRSAFENNPANPKFRQFWYTVTGCKKGDIFGPLPLPEHDAMQPGPDGKPVRKRMPPAYVVLQIQNEVPARPKTFEEAQQELVIPIVYRRVMDALRKEYGIEIYEDKLYRPEGYGDQYKNAIIKTNIAE
jgi:PPIC-type PPIASE domain